MDSHGYFSLSVSAIYERDLIDQGALVLLEVNPNFPRTFGDTQVHISEVDALVESDRPIPTKSLVPYTEVDKKNWRLCGLSCRGRLHHPARYRQHPKRRGK